MSVIITVDGDKRDYNYHLQSSGSTLTGITYSGLVTTMTLPDGATFYTGGTAFFINSSGRIDESDADTSSTMPVYCILCEFASGGDEVTVLLQGFFRLDSWSWTPGGLIYASTSPGLLTQTAPSGTGDQVQVVGVATDAVTIHFKPEYTLVQI